MRQMIASKQCTRCSANLHMATRTAQARSRVRKEGGGARRGETRAVWERWCASSTRKEVISFSSLRRCCDCRSTCALAYSNDWSRTARHQHAHHTRTQRVVRGSCALASPRACRDSARPAQGRRASAHPPCIAYCGHSCVGAMAWSAQGNLKAIVQRCRSRRFQTLHVGSGRHPQRTRRVMFARAVTFAPHTGEWTSRR